MILVGILHIQILYNLFIYLLISIDQGDGKVYNLSTVRLIMQERVKYEVLTLFALGGGVDSTPGFKNA